MFLSITIWQSLDFVDYHQSPYNYPYYYFHLYQLLIYIYIWLLKKYICWASVVILLNWSVQVWRDKPISLIRNCAIGVNTTTTLWIFTNESFHWRDKLNHSFGNADIHFHNVCYIFLFTPLIVSTFVYCWVSPRPGDE